MSHGRHARPGLAQKAANNTGPIVLSGVVAAGIATTGAFNAIPANAATVHVTHVTQDAHLADIMVPAKPTFTPNPKYTVKLGNTLSGISEDHCGTANDWPGIYNANKQVIGGDPNLIEVGQKLQLECTNTPPPLSFTKTKTSATAKVTPMTDSVGGLVSQLDAQGYDGSAMAATALFLVKNGYSRIGAAGIIACIAGESGGNPESVGSGGGGLIGWTPLSVPVTGNSANDLNAQLPALLRYNNQFGSGPLYNLNHASNPVAAADYYSQEFERPAVTDSDVRSNVAYTVYTYL